MTNTLPDLADTPIAYDQIDGIHGGTETVWENRFGRMSLVPSVNGPYISLSRPDGISCVGLFVLASDGERILLVRQHRWPIGTTTWELPAGGWDANETKAAGAARELLEETSVVVAAGDLVDVGDVIPNGSRVNGRDHIFFARVDPSEVAASDEKEISDAAWFPIEEVVDACANGDVTSGTTVVAILRAKLLGLI